MSAILKWLPQLIKDGREIASLPTITVNLMRDAARANHPFFLKCIEDFYRQATRPHARFPLIRNYDYGVAVCVLPPTHESYFASIEGSARRNVRKAERLGYAFSRMKINDWLADVGEIGRSAFVRQGPVAANLHAEPRRNTDPESLTNTHDYPYFGVFRDGHCYAYCGCLVSGELISIGTIFGHDAHKSDGVVPLLLVGVAKYAMQSYPNVRYYMYDKYFGAGETLRRFKKKFNFLPHRVRWRL